MSDSLSRRKLARAAARLAVAVRSPLPALVLMTDDERLPDPLGAIRALPPGSMVIVRARQAERRRMLATETMKIARRRGLMVVIAADAELARAVGADGVHLPEAQGGKAARLHATSRLFVTTAAHSLAALRKAQGADAVLLSPVFSTASHPGARTLTPLRAAAMARLSRVPVYALGGVDAANAGRLAGFSGIAAIGALAVP
jgi:thiamine-phosphate pyrophosphorylase